MSRRDAAELLYDSETTLRLVDEVLGELREADGPQTRPAAAEPADAIPATPSQSGIGHLPNLLLSAYAEIQKVLDSLRQSRDVLERTTVEKIQHTSDKLAEVSLATEIAATDMLDGLDRSLALIDQLDAGENSDTEREEISSGLRNEIYRVMGCLQFQDITSQQLNYASSVLRDMESRLSQLATLFDPANFGSAGLLAPLPARESDVTFDPAATTTDASERQALVDEIFGR